jgi:hypothetical protein
MLSSGMKNTSSKCDNDAQILRAFSIRIGSSPLCEMRASCSSAREKKGTRTLKEAAPRMNPG